MEKQAKPVDQKSLINYLKQARATQFTHWWEHFTAFIPGTNSFKRKKALDEMMSHANFLAKVLPRFSGSENLDHRQGLEHINESLEKLHDYATQTSWKNPADLGKEGAAEKTSYTSDKWATRFFAELHDFLTPSHNALTQEVSKRQERQETIKELTASLVNLRVELTQVDWAFKLDNKIKELTSKAQEAMKDSGKIKTVIGDCGFDMGYKCHNCGNGHKEYHKIYIPDDAARAFAKEELDSILVSTNQEALSEALAIRASLVKEQANIKEKVRQLEAIRVVTPLSVIEFFQKLFELFAPAVSVKELVGQPGTSETISESAESESSRTHSVHSSAMAPEYIEVSVPPIDNEPSEPPAYDEVLPIYRSRVNSVVLFTPAAAADLSDEDLPPEYVSRPSSSLRL